MVRLEVLSGDYMTEKSERGRTFTVPATAQGKRVVDAMTTLLSGRLVGTPAEPLFAKERMSNAALGMHVRKLSGALIAAANGELGEQDVAWLTRVHQDAHITGEQFDYVVGGVAGALTEAGEDGAVQAILPLVPTLREAFIQPPQQA